MAGELIAQMAQNALTNVGPFSNFMSGAQDYNTLQNQLLNNQLLQQRASQEQLMNPLLIQEAQNKLALQGQDVTTGQMKLDQAKQGQLIRDMKSIATEALQMPGNARRQHILGRLKTVDFAGLDENELINEIGQLDDTQLEQSLRSMMTAADTSEQTAEQKNRAELLKILQPALDEKGNFDPSKANAAQKAAAVALKIYEGAGTKTLAERRAEDLEMSQQITDIAADESGRIAGSKAESEMDVFLRRKPDLEAGIVRAKRREELLADLDAQMEKTGRDAESVDYLLDTAEELIPESTQSGVGALTDYAGSLVGISTTGAEVADKLKILGGHLVMKMPRFEGSQSVYDAQKYTEMAGSLGDPTIPAPRRLAALKTIREMFKDVAEKAAKRNRGSAQGGMTETTKTKETVDDPKKRLEELRRKAGM